MLSYSTVEIESIHYSVIATVPYNDVIKSSKEVEASINKTVVDMIVAFTLIMFFFVVLHFFFSRFLVRSIIDPIDQLRNLVHLISEDNYSGSIPENPSSLDVKVLLEAFSNLVVALKFANENLSRGNKSLAEQIYTDALNLFTATGNIKGLGASHNNLAAIDMSKNSFVSAETHYYQSIKYCETAIEKAQSSEESLRLKKTLSDRKGNLALLYLERNDMTEKYPVAFEMLEKLLLEDKKLGYIKGCVVKQGTLGQFYLRQGEMASAQKILESALNFVQLKDASIFEGVTYHISDISMFIFILYFIF
jgi:tetratricopeptide (TPR) repeat protein